MLDWFGKALYWTLVGGFFIMGIVTGLAMLQIIAVIAGGLLSTSVGTVILLYIVWRLYKHYTAEQRKE